MLRLCCWVTAQCALPHEYAEAIAAHRARVDNIRALAASVASAEGADAPGVQTESGGEIATQLPAVSDIYSTVACELVAQQHVFLASRLASHLALNLVSAFPSVLCLSVCARRARVPLQVIHAHFKDWLARSGNLSQINDLLQFDLEMAAKWGNIGATSPYSAPPVTPTKPR